MSTTPKIRDLTPQDVSAALTAHRILLIDVREPAEFAAERIHGALNYPLSTFDPGALPPAGDRLMVFQCGSGKRSAMALERCQAAGHAVDSHLGGGIMAWKAAGLPTVSLDVATGGVRDAR
ncbi:MAG: rhodanese-like domain-containing protein [Phenylobacterium sp.]|uniref:rhodanese-like domain-containing protein n=1 Tax=Phenylobacterium sp. TaxID=1871053 RepID=UPI0025DAB6C5|nr:rhodanese-like domain-containing protein [Phenylobacterium sp.]MBI1196988.1 rhodanese-like domain-containing protein [Phenylobacterium sp.]